MGLEIKFEGVDELRVALDERTNLNAVKTVVRKNGAELQSKAQRNAPVDTGTLKRSIGLELSDGGLTATSEATVHYAPYVEYGTRKMEAQPYMKPAFNVQKGIFKADLDKLVR